MRIAAIKAGVFKPLKKIEVVPRCLEHAFEELGFSTPWDLALYLDELSRRAKGREGRNVAIPREKVPLPGVRAVGVRCKRCKGRGAGCKCQYGWGVICKVPIRKREHEHRCTPREAAPTTPATAVTATPNAGPATPTV